MRRCQKLMNCSKSGRSTPNISVSAARIAAIASGEELDRAVMRPSTDSTGLIGDRCEMKNIAVTPAIITARS